MMRRTGVALALMASLFVIPALAVDLPITATGAIVVDAGTGEILYQHNADLELPPASTTKVLTAIVALESGRMDDSLEVSSFAASTPPTKVGFPVGSRVRLQDLLYAVLLKSANDAAEVVAEGLAGSQEEFADRMNAKARRIGANNSHFENPHGLTADGHVTTARDLARIFRYGLNIPMFREILNTRAIDFPVEEDGVRMVTVKSHNRLLSGYTYPVIGKTGFTRVAKRCFVGAATGDNREVVIALLGSRDLWGDSRKLIEFGLEGKTIFDDTPPTVMAARETEEEEEPSPYAYERAARAHQRNLPPVIAVRPAVVRPAPPLSRTMALAAVAAAPNPAQFVRRWVTTSLRGRTVRTLVAEPVRGTEAVAPRVASAGRRGQLIIPETTREARRADTRASARDDNDDRRRGRRERDEISTASRAKDKPSKTAVKVPVGKLARDAAPTTASAKRGAKSAPEATKPAKTSAAAAPHASATKVKVSGQRPSVVARR